MGVRKYYEISCDSCDLAIGHYSGCSKKMAVEFSEDEGAITKNKLNFCDDECLSNYKSDQKRKRKTDKPKWQNLM